MMRQRTYLNGTLCKSSKPRDVETARRWLDNVETHWRNNGVHPLTPAGEFEPNNAHEVTRVSADELLVVTTGGNRLRFVNVEVKQ